MSYIRSVRPHEGLRITPTSELEHAPRAVVQFGTAPDGLPWLLEVDRSHRLQNLFSAVLRAFDLSRLEDLPKRVRDALQDDVAAGLMGVHSVELQADAGRTEVYVSRRNAKDILGRSLLSQLLEGGPDTPISEPSYGGDASTNAGVMTTDPADAYYAEAVERAIRDRQSSRHLLLVLASGDAWVGTVHSEDRALRTPQGPYRPMVFESLKDFAGTQARFQASDGEVWTVPLDDWEQYSNAMLRAQQNPYGGRVSFVVSKAAILDVLIKLARVVGAMHADGVVHGDLTPSNVLIDRGEAVSFDALNIETGTVAAAATFEWAAPEQIVGLPMDPRADVFAIGRMLTALVGGVPFGEQTQYVIPTGGLKSRSVSLLKTDGVFIDILDSEHTREWQITWQAFLGKCLAYDRDKRPGNGASLADELAALAKAHPVQGTIEFLGSFGVPVQMETSDNWTFARRVAD